MLIEIPLLHDHHSHPLLYAAFTSAANLSQTDKLDHACEMIRDVATPDGIAVAHGWKDNVFSFSHETLESLPPVAIFNLSLHLLLVNEAGKQLLHQQFGKVSENIRDHDWYERNLRVVLNWFALMNGSPERLAAFYDQLEKIGVWSVEELLLVDPKEIDWFDEAGLADRTTFWAAPDTFSQLSQCHKDRIHGLKLFTDGAIGARSAALSEPYLGQPENRGMLIYKDGQLEAKLAECSNLLDRIAIHAIGDRAIEQTITSIENTGVSNRFKQIRIEHAQLLSRSQATRAIELGITLSMQPNFSIDSTDYADRLPPKLAQANNPFRMLIDEVGFEPGSNLILGSDGMPHGAKPALQQSLSPPLPNQQLTFEEFKLGYCSDHQAKFRCEV